MLKPLKVRPNVPGDQERYERDMKDFTEQPENWGYTSPRVQLVPVPIGGAATSPPGPLSVDGEGEKTAGPLTAAEREELEQLRAEKAAREAAETSPTDPSPQGAGETEQKPVAVASPKGRRKRPAGKPKTSPE